MTRDHLKTLTEDQRICVLRTLEAAPGYKANEGVIQASLDMYGHAVSRDQVSGLTSWLEEAELVSVEALTDDIRIITITGRGQDVAKGRARYPGVKRPRAR